MSDDPLARVYAAQTPEELEAAYADWAATYDRDAIRDGYHLPFSIAAWVARHVKPGDGPILDAGCGSGLSGPVPVMRHGLDGEAALALVATAALSFATLTALLAFVVAA